MSSQTGELFEGGALISTTSFLKPNCEFQANDNCCVPNASEQHDAEDKIDKGLLLQREGPGAPAAVEGLPPFARLQRRHFFHLSLAFGPILNERYLFQADEDKSSAL